MTYYAHSHAIVVVVVAAAAADVVAADFAVDDGADVGVDGVAQSSHHLVPYFCNFVVQYALQDRHIVQISPHNGHIQWDDHFSAHGIAYDGSNQDINKRSGMRIQYSDVQSVGQMNKIFCIGRNIILQEKIFIHRKIISYYS